MLLSKQTVSLKAWKWWKTLPKKFETAIVLLDVGGSDYSLEGPKP